MTERFNNHIRVFLAGMMIGLPSIGATQPGGDTDFARIRSAAVEPNPVTPGKKATLTVTVAIAEGFHINANQPGSDMYIPTVLTVSAPKTAGITLGPVVYPKPRTIPVSFDPKPLKAYEETITITVPVTVPSNAKPGVVRLSGSLRAQGCNDTTCFPPKTFPIAVRLTIAGGK
ncbi:MAG: protein-disulfide reductase DsbD family protein [Capsulimonadales bacterium]|nr:protein-disulfide reductase DsbD family protein [Capsulimonadales bacterium]